MNASFLTFSVWIICFILTYGLTFPYLQSLWPKRAFEHRIKDRIASFFLSLGGPFSLAYFVIVIGEFKNGFKL